MTNDSAKDMVRFEEAVAETNPVAVIRQEYTEINSSKELYFQNSYDDLDYLVYTILPLASGNKVALVRHKHSPNSGTEICVSCYQSNIPSVILETLDILDLATQDLTWIHKDYKQKVYQSGRKLSVQNNSEP